jgi:hypothetical protein
MRKMEKPERGKDEEGHRFRKAHPLGPPTEGRYSQRLFPLTLRYVLRTTQGPWKSITLNLAIAS